MKKSTKKNTQELMEHERTMEEIEQILPEELSPLVKELDHTATETLTDGRLVVSNMRIEMLKASLKPLCSIAESVESVETELKFTEEAERIKELSYHLKRASELALSIKKIPEAVKPLIDDLAPIGATRKMEGGVALKPGPIRKMLEYLDSIKTEAMGETEDDKVTVKIEPIKKLSKHLKSSTVGVGSNDARYIIQTYYQLQDYRISLGNQINSINRLADEPEETQHELLDWLFSNIKQMEEETEKAIKSYVENNPVGRWLLQIKGIGPILAGGLISYFDIKKAPSVSHFYSYAGLNDNNNPWLGREKAREIVIEVVSKNVTDQELLELSRRTTRKFEALCEMALDPETGKRSREKLIKDLSKVPYNADLKKLCWKIGESFVKVSGRGSLYGRIYKERKDLETRRNEEGEYADQAAAILAKKNISKSTDAYRFYSQGKLPPAHIHARAKRYAVKIFISHLFDEMYKHEYHKEPPRSYVFEYLGHVDKIEPEVPGIEV